MSRRNEPQRIFDDYLPREVVDAGLLESTFFRGHLRVVPSNWRIANVTCAGLSVDVVIDENELRNRAIHGDEVAIELLKESRWMSVKQKKSSSNEDNAIPFENENDNEVQEELWHVQK